jgi:cytochrome c-type biogenesis protein CcmH/NrfF
MARLLRPRVNPSHAIAGRLWRVLGVFALTSLLAGSALAQHGPVDPPSPTSTPENIRKAQSISRQTMSPFCPGRTLSDCPSEYAGQWRHDIQRMVDQGKTPAEIQKELERRAGGDLSGSPNRGVGWGLPIGFSLAALLVLGGVLRYLRSKKEEDKAEAVKQEAAEDRTSAEERAALDKRLEHELDEELADEDEAP